LETQLDGGYEGRFEGSDLPLFLYGTAWKEERTRAVTLQALAVGFRGIDTANQRRHYHEAEVGAAIGEAIQAGRLQRSELFLQTKFTFRAGQDHRLPYDPAAAVAQQVRQSFDSSLRHLGVTTLDSYILHGPSQRYGLSASDWEAWRAMEALCDEGRVGQLGVSNVTIDQLRELSSSARIGPRFVQNRCFAVQRWDADVRHFCRAQGMIYQGFSLLTANHDYLFTEPIVRLANKYHRTAAQVVFRFALDVGIWPLTGSTNGDHLRQDLSIDDFRLLEAEIGQVERIAVRAS
jgi:diketogulonate reductase-like aldo/keto reductase